MTRRTPKAKAADPYPYVVLGAVILVALAAILYTVGMPQWPQGNLRGAATTPNGGTSVQTTTTTTSTGTPAGFAPALDPIDGITYLAAATGSGVQVSVNGNGGRFVWRTGYYLKDAQWNPFTFSTPGIAGTNWTNGSLNAALPADAPTDGYVIVYACKKYPGRANFTCGPRNATSPSSERRWTIVQYQIAPTGCTDDCAIGATMCASTQVRSCGNYDTDTCREWGTAQDCPTGQTCQGSACTTAGSNGDTRPLCSTQPRTQCTSAMSGGSLRSDLQCSCAVGPCPEPPLKCYQCPDGQSPAYDAATGTYRCAVPTTTVDVPRFMGGIDGLDWAARVQNGVQTGPACDTNARCTGVGLVVGCFSPGDVRDQWTCAYGGGQQYPALYQCDASHYGEELSAGGTAKVCCAQSGGAYVFQAGACQIAATEERLGVAGIGAESCWDGVDNDDDGAFDLQGGSGSGAAEGADCPWAWNDDIEAPASVTVGSSFSVWCSSDFGWQTTGHAGPKRTGGSATTTAFGVWDATKGKYRSEFTAGTACTIITIACGTDKGSIFEANPGGNNLEATINCQGLAG